jgi:regulator of protease activity HflC (stomatin/prohibitin superfamily)
MLAEREKLNADLQRILDEQTESWGIKVSNVELKHVDIDESMIRVIARQAEAERIRRAKIIESEGEFQAAQKFLDAATILSARPQAMQLRYLSTLMTIANERSSIIVFPFPTDVAQMFGSAPRRADHGSSD